MAFNLGDIFVTFKAKTDDLKRGAGEVQKLVKETEDNSNKLAASTGRLAAFGRGAIEVLAKATAVAGTAATAAGAFAVKSAADFEQTRIGMEAMLGSAEAAQKVLGELSKFAAATPFEFPELAASTRQLIAFGFSADEALATIKNLGDVAAATQTPIGDLAYLFGTLRAQGRAFTIDIRQFTNRGIPILEYLAKTLSKSKQEIQEMIEAGQIGFPEVNRAFQAMTSEGGIYFGMMAKQSKSLSGLFSTLKDNIGLAAREIIGINQQGDVRAGSIFDKLRNGVAGLNQMLSNINWVAVVDDMTRRFSDLASRVRDVAIQIGDYLGPKLAALWDTLTNQFGPAIGGLISALGPAAGAGLVWAFGVVVDAARLFMEFFTPMINWIKDNTWIIWGVVGALGALKVALAIDAAVTAFKLSMAAVSASAASTTTVVGLLRGALILLTNPWVIGLTIVGVAAVLYGLQQIQDALDRLIKKWQDARAEKIDIGASGTASKTSDAGIIRGFMRHFGFAQGTDFAPGGLALVGEKGPELVNLPRGSQVIPNDKLSGLKGDVNFYGDVHIDSEQDADYLMQRINRNSFLATKGVSEA